jgi:predicted ATPase
VSEAGVARRFLGFTCLLQGELIKAQATLEQALQTYDAERDSEIQFRFGMDTAVGATQYLAQTSSLLGKFDCARKQMEDAITLAIKSEYVPNQTNAYMFKALFEVLRYDAAATLQASEAVSELSRQHGITFFLAAGSFLSSWGRARLGSGQVETVREALATYAKQGNTVYMPVFQSLLAELEAETDHAGALERVDAALTLAVTTGEHWADALLRRIRGDIILKSGPLNTEGAESAFLDAITIAKKQKAKSFELRASMSLARLWREQGKVREARELLAPVYGWFTEGFDTRDLKDAKALLEELAA